MDVECDTIGTHAHLVLTNSRHRCGDFVSLACTFVPTCAPFTLCGSGSMCLVKMMQQHIGAACSCFHKTPQAVHQQQPCLLVLCWPRFGVVGTLDVTILVAVCVHSVLRAWYVCGLSAFHVLALTQHRCTCLFHRSSVLVGCSDHTASMNTNTTTSKARKCWCTPPLPCSHTQSY